MKIIFLNKNVLLLLIFLLLNFLNFIDSQYQENNDIFSLLEKGFNCKKNNNNNFFIEINLQNEAKIFHSKIPFLLYIISNWCDYCCQQTEVLLNVQKYLLKTKNNSLNKIKIYQIQSNEYNNIIKKYKIFLTKTPSLYLVKNNKEIKQYSSYYRKKDIIYFIKKNILPIQILNSIEETELFINNNKNIKLIGFFTDKKKYFNEYEDFIKYSEEINYRMDVEIRICIDRNVVLFLQKKYEENLSDETNFIFLKRYDKIYYLNLSLKSKNIKYFIYYNTFSPVEEISDNNREIIMNLKTPIALFFIDTTYNLNNYHKVMHYLEKLSYDFDLKYIFTILDGGVKTDLKVKLGLDNNFPTLVIHKFGDNKHIKFPMNKLKFTDKNIKLFLKQNLINNNYKKNDETIKIIKNKEILMQLKGIQYITKNNYNNIIFNIENKRDLLLFIIDEYSFNEKEIMFSKKIGNIMKIIDEYGIEYYLDIFWISKYDLIQYKNEIQYLNNEFKISNIDYLLNSKIIIKNDIFNGKKFELEIDKIKDYDFILWLKENINNKFEIQRKGDYYEELYYRYKTKIILEY